MLNDAIVTIELDYTVNPDSTSEGWTTADYLGRFGAAEDGTVIAEAPADGATVGGDGGMVIKGRSRDYIIKAFAPGEEQRH